MDSSLRRLAVVAQQVQRVPDPTHQGLVDGEGHAPPPPVRGQQGVGHPDPVAEGPRPLRGLQQRRVVLTAAGRSLRRPEADEQVDAERRVLGLGVLEQVQGPAVEAGCLVESRPIEGLGPRPGVVVQARSSPPAVAASAKWWARAVMSPGRRRSIDSPILQVHPHPPGGTHLLQQGRADEGVDEAVATRSGLLDEAGVDGDVQGLEHVVLVAVDQVDQHGEVDVPADDRRPAEHVVDLVGQAGHPAADHLPYPLGDGHVLQVHGRLPHAVALDDGAGLRQVAQDLAHEEGVALGLGVHGRGEGPLGVVQFLARRGGDERLDLLGGEPGQREALDPGRPAQVGEQLAQRMGPVQVGVAVGADDQDPTGLLGPEEVAQEEQRGLARPVQVVEDQHEAVGLCGGGEPGRRSPRRVGGARRRRRRGSARPVPGRGRPTRGRAAAALPDGDRGPRAAARPGWRSRPGPRRRAGRAGPAPRRTGRATRRPRRRGPGRAISPDSRVLPTPGSPANRAQRRSPARASFHSRVISSTSVGRPTKGMLWASYNSGGNGGWVPRPLVSRRPGDLDGPHRGGQALERELPDLPERVAAPPPGQRLDQVGGQHLPAVGGGTEPRRLDDRRAEAVVVLQGDVTRTQAHPDRQLLVQAIGGHGDGPPVGSPPRPPPRRRRRGTWPAHRRRVL